MTLIAFLFPFLLTQPTDSPNSGINYQQVTNDSVVVIRKIEVQGNFKTKENIILRELAFRAGDTLQKNKINDFLEHEREKIFNLNLFNFVKVSLKNEANNEADVEIEVKERWYYVIVPTFRLADRNFSEWWYDHNHDFSRTIYGIYAAHNNLTGRNDKLRLTAEAGFIPSFSLSYTTPYLDKAQRTNAAIGTSYSVNHNLAFRNFNDKLDFIETEKRLRESWSVGASVSRRQGFYQFHSLAVGFNSTKIADTVVQRNPDYFLSGTSQQKIFSASYSYQYDNRDSRQYSLKGERFTFQIARLGLFSGDDISQFVLTSTYTKYFGLGGRFFGNFSVRGKVSFPEKQPYLQTIGLGYSSDYVRGYELYVVDGQSYMLFKTNLKFRLLDKVFDLAKFLKIRQFNTLPLSAYVNSFVDFGYAKNQ
jgi:outer membrane protein assembly factor BamA